LQVKRNDTLELIHCGFYEYTYFLPLSYPTLQNNQSQFAPEGRGIYPKGLKGSCKSVAIHSKNLTVNLSSFFKAFSLCFFPCFVKAILKLLLDIIDC
jgi:hypothetical protein